MSIPGPLAVGRRLYGVLVRRPRGALRPYLHESYPEEPTLFDEAMTISSGAGSLVLVALGALACLALALLYALLYALLAGVVRLVGAARARVGR